MGHGGFLGWRIGIWGSHGSEIPPTSPTGPSWYPDQTPLGGVHKSCFDFDEILATGVSWGLESEYRSHLVQKIPQHPPQDPPGHPKTPLGVVTKVALILMKIWLRGFLQVRNRNIGVAWFRNSPNTPHIWLDIKPIYWNSQ